MTLERYGTTYPERPIDRQTAIVAREALWHLARTDHPLKDEMVREAFTNLSEALGYDETEI